MKKPYFNNIKREVSLNKNYRNVVYTVPDSMQLVLMNIPVNQGIPSEIHPHTTQLIRIEKGTALITIRKTKYQLETNDTIIIPPNTKHRVENIGNTTLKLSTIYTHPEHKDGLIQKTNK